LLLGCLVVEEPEGRTIRPAHFCFTEVRARDVNLYYDADELHIYRRKSGQRQPKRGEPGSSYLGELGNFHYSLTSGEFCFVRQFDDRDHGHLVLVNYPFLSSLFFYRRGNFSLGIMQPGSNPKNQQNLVERVNRLERFLKKLDE
jgi:hypothetical protein